MKLKDILNNKQTISEENIDNYLDLTESFYGVHKNYLKVLKSLKALTPEDLKLMKKDKKMGWQGKEVKLWTSIVKLIEKSDISKNN